MKKIFTWSAQIENNKQKNHKRNNSLSMGDHLCTNKKVLWFNVPVYDMLSMAIYKGSSQWCNILPQPQNNTISLSVSEEHPHD